MTPQLQGAFGLIRLVTSNACVCLRLGVCGACCKSVGVHTTFIQTSSLASSYCFYNLYKYGYHTSTSKINSYLVEQYLYVLLVIFYSYRTCSTTVLVVIFEYQVPVALVARVQ